MAVAALLASGRLAQAPAAASDTDCGRAGSSAAGGLGAAAVRALLVLEAAQVRRKVSAPLRLASAALYSMLGAPAAATRHFSALGEQPQADIWVCLHLHVHRLSHSCC